MRNRVGPGLLMSFVSLFLLLIDASLILAAEQGFTEPITCMEFVWVPGGSFQMGQTDLEKDDLIKAIGRAKFDKYCASELPCHKVYVDGFWMGKYEVTNIQYRRFKSDHDSKVYQGFSLNDDKQPVVEVSCEDAAAYAVWLTSKSGRRFRLPTEAEWEYACRAGTTTVRFWGDDPDLACAYANVGDLTARNEWPVWIVHNCEDEFIVTAPVGSFLPNSFGFHDMLGNVWEWCSGWFGEDYYKNSPEFNPPGLSAGIYRIARGSCWDSPPRYVRSASRNKRLPDSHGYGIGFRLISPGPSPSDTAPSQHALPAAR